MADELSVKALCPICHAPRDGDEGQYSHGSVTCFRVLKDALRGLLPYVDTSKVGAYRASEAVEKALGKGTDGS